MRNRFRRAPLLIVAVIMVILSGRTAVVADTPLDESGRRGVHYLADSEEYPGTACRYNADNVLMSLRVRDPFVFAADHPKGQVVGWRVLVQANDGSAGGWSTVARSRIQLHGLSMIVPRTSNLSGRRSTLTPALPIASWCG